MSLDEFSALDQLVVGAVPRLMMKTPAKGLSSSVVAHNDPASQSASRVMPSMTSPVVSQRTSPLVMPQSPHVSIEHPTVQAAIQNVAASLGKTHSVPPSHPAIQEAATAIVVDSVNKAPAGQSPAVLSSLATSESAAISATSAIPASAVASAVASTPDTSSSDSSSSDAAAQAMAQPTSPQSPQYSGSRKGKHAMAQLQNGPDRQFVQPLGFLLAAIATTVIADVTSKPQGVAFKPTRVVVPSNIAPYFTLQNMRIGTDSQLVGTTEVSAMTFTETAVGVALEMGTAPSGIDITITAKNIDTVTHDFRASMLGIVFKG